MFRGLWQSVMTRTHCYSIPQNFPKSPLCSTYCLSFPLSFPFHCRHSFAFSRTSYSWNHICVAFADWLSTWQYAFKFPPSFCGLVAHFFVLLNNVPLSWRHCFFFIVELQEFFTLDTSPLSDTGFVTIFPSLWLAYPFSLWYFLRNRKKPLILMRPNF